ncbi:MAG: hypothetical protein KGL39_28950 [Patescibacteria group bacterium]|nr:hypothetical protein [Patescibacteria group bacterium]
MDEERQAELCRILATGGHVSVMREAAAALADLYRENGMCLLAAMLDGDIGRVNGDIGRAIRHAEAVLASVEKDRPIDGHANDETRRALESLCRRVASLHEEGLDVFAKSCIMDARKLCKRLF